MTLCLDPEMFRNHKACTFPFLADGFCFFPQPPRDIFTDGEALALPEDEKTRVMTMTEFAFFLEACETNP